MNRDSTEYQAFLERYETAVKSRLKTGDEVYVLSEYNLRRAQVVSLAGNTAKVFIPGHGFYRDDTKNIPYKKLAPLGLPVVVVWERWVGINGRGGYRLDNETYPDVSNPPEKIPHQVHLYEDKPFASTDSDFVSYQEFFDAKSGKRPKPF